MWYVCVCTSSISVSKPIIHLPLKPRVLANISSPSHTWGRHSPASSGSRFSDVTVRSWILLPPAVPLTHPPCLSQPSSHSSLVSQLVLSHPPSDVGRARRSGIARASRSSTHLGPRTSSWRKRLYCAPGSLIGFVSSQRESPKEAPGQSVTNSSADLGAAPTPLQGPLNLVAP